MYKIFPFVPAVEFSLPNLPVELWTIILRCLDPTSLLTAARSNDLWKQIAQGDPVLRKTIKDQRVLEKRRRREEMLSPGLLLSITRDGPNATKIVRRQVPARGPVTTPEKRKRRHNKDTELLRKKIMRSQRFIIIISKQYKAKYGYGLSKWWQFSSGMVAAPRTQSVVGDDGSDVCSTGHLDSATLEMTTSAMRHRRPRECDPGDDYVGDAAQGTWTVRPWR
ncbi:hypothetical protein Zmor_006871 [Zophobas morio]|uniref:F-box domain-containing protein n=1 Tax=Zophobas morio TaxID=2755281 RepID=A0AA38MN20_9CUCU|nr:hypothetical protein Zmor_006871 [Zophobas morio]